MRRSFLVLLIVCGCGNAKLISRDPSGGTIHIGGNHERAMEKAEDLMRAHCGRRGYAITREGEEPIGVDTSWHSVTEKTDYRVHYACGPEQEPRGEAGH
jgi:hypothetical protein